MPPNATTGPRAYGAAHFALELDQQKKQVGLFKSIEGGGFKQDLIKYNAGPYHQTFFRQGRLKYEDIKVQVGMSMSEPFYQWVSCFFTGQNMRKTGAIVAADFYYNERARREFAEAMITEVQFPKLDGNDKGPCYMAVTITPETVTYKAGSGQKILEGPGFDSQKLWAACNFDFKIDSFETACKRVTKVDAFTVKQKALEYNVGGRRDTIRVGSRVEYPNLSFYLPESDAQQFIKHHETYTQKGNVQADSRHHGEINTYDNQGGKLFTIQFAGVEIFNVTHDKSDSTSEEIKQVKVEICVESMSFTYLPFELE